MGSSEFPSRQLSRHEPQLLNGAEPAPAQLYGRVEPPPTEVAGVPGYVSFLDYWRLLVRQKMTLLRFAVTGLILAVLISFVQTPVYRSRTSLEIQDFNENFLDLKSVDPTNSSGTAMTADSYFQTQIKLLHSESLLERVINKLKLEQARVAHERSLSYRVRRVLGFKNSGHLPDQETLIAQAENSLTIRGDGKTRLLEVLYESPDARLAADFANTLVSEFMDQSQGMRWQSIQRTSQWLTSHLEDMKAKLERSEAQLQEYARSSGLNFTAENDNVAAIKLRELQEELLRAEADRVAKEAKFVEAKNKPTDSLPETLDDPALRDHRLKLTDLQRQLAELSETLTPAHYKVRRVQAQIAELEAATGRQRSLIRRRIGNEYAAALRREKLLADAYARQEKTVADQSAKAIPYDTLKREVDSTRQIYQSMLQRVKEAELAAAMRVSNVVVVDPAKPPLLPYRPNLLMNAAVGLFSGVFLGLGFILFRERVNRRIQSPGDAQAYLHVPELGVLPVAETANSRQISGNGKLYPLRLNAAPEVAPESPCEHPELATWYSKPSLLAESIRATLTSILFAGENGDHPQLVVFTSPCQGDGKTTVVTNLSIAMAEIGRTVLLIDADLRRPRLHKLFGIANDCGLGGVLCGDTPLDEIVPMLRLRCKTNVPGLYVLPSGTSTITSTSLFYSPRMARLFEQVRNEFDMVLVDAPPMILADARVLGRLADGVVLVMRAGQTTPEGARFVSQRLVEDGTRLLGTVLNGWDPDTSGYGYYGYKQYYGRYGSKEK